MIKLASSSSNQGDFDRDTDESEFPLVECTALTDVVTFEPRGALKLFTPIFKLVFYLVFLYRHHRLRKKFAKTA